MARLDEPWPMIQDAYLKAWAYRPSRAEPLCAIAIHYCAKQEWQLGYFFAERAAKIPLPKDILFVRADMYTFSAPDVLAICAARLGKHEEAFLLCRRLLALEGIAEKHLIRIAKNRDYSVPAMLDAATAYPEELARSLQKGSRHADVTITLITGPDRTLIERTLNSLLHCCSDIALAGRFLLIDTGLLDQDREWLLDRYPFLKAHSMPNADLPAIRRKVHGRFWMHIPGEWQFFGSADYISRMTAILEAEPEVIQVGVNLGDAEGPCGSYARQGEIRTAPTTGRYVLAGTTSDGPAMYATNRFDRPEGGGPLIATLDEVLALRTR
jgi:hypothetical protein